MTIVMTPKTALEVFMRRHGWYKYRERYQGTIRVEHWRCGGPRNLDDLRLLWPGGYRYTDVMAAIARLAHRTGMIDADVEQWVDYICEKYDTFGEAKFDSEEWTDDA